MTCDIAETFVIWDYESAKLEPNFASTCWKAFLECAEKSLKVKIVIKGFIIFCDVRSLNDSASSILCGLKHAELLHINCFCAGLLSRKIEAKISQLIVDFPYHNGTGPKGLFLLISGQIAPLENALDSLKRARWSIFLVDNDRSKDKSGFDYPFVNLHEIIDAIPETAQQKLSSSDSVTAEEDAINYLLVCGLPTQSLKLIPDLMKISIQFRGKIIYFNLNAAEVLISIPSLTDKLNAVRDEFNKMLGADVSVRPLLDLPPSLTDKLSDSAIYRPNFDCLGSASATEWKQDTILPEFEHCDDDENISDDSAVSGSGSTSNRPIKHSMQCYNWKHCDYWERDGHCNFWHPKVECKFFRKCTKGAKICDYGHPFCGEYCKCPPSKKDTQLNHRMRKTLEPPLPSKFIKPQKSKASNASQPQKRR